MPARAGRSVRGERELATPHTHSIKTVTANVRRMALRKYEGLSASVAEKTRANPDTTAHMTNSLARPPFHAPTRTATQTHPAMYAKNTTMTVEMGGRSMGLDGGGSRPAKFLGLQMRARKRAGEQVRQS